MDQKSFEENFLYEQNYWWFLGRRRIVNNLIKKYFYPVRKKAPPEFSNGVHKKSDVLALDIGCGTGIILNDLGAYAVPVGIDPSEIAMEFTKKRGHKNLVCGDACNLPFKGEVFDLITILGVLYNKGIKSDDTAIKETWRVLKKGGVLIIDEAAYSSLQSKHNVSVGGMRRYTRSQLIDKCKKCNLHVLKSSYWNVLMLPIFYLIVKLEKYFLANQQYSKLSNIPTAVNYILKSYLYLEAFLIKYINFPFGPSVIIAAKKNAAD